VSRRWFCHTGAIISVPDATPLTTFRPDDGLTHRLMGDGLGMFVTQAVTRCGRRGCFEIPGRGPVTCQECRVL
jgi:hypothetical protein